jgi:hypothetical protein
VSPWVKKKKDRTAFGIHIYAHNRSIRDTDRDRDHTSVWRVNCQFGEAGPDRQDKIPRNLPRVHSQFTPRSFNLRVILYKNISVICIYYNYCPLRKPYFDLV